MRLVSVLASTLLSAPSESEGQVKADDVRGAPTVVRQSEDENFQAPLRRAAGAGGWVGGRLLALTPVPSRRANPRRYQPAP